MSNAQLAEVSPLTQQTDLTEKLALQRRAFRAEPFPSLQQRKQRLIALKTALQAHSDKLVEALNKDYGGRAEFDCRLADIAPCIQGINYTLKKLRRWMKPESRHVGWAFQPASAWVEPQPLGVVGIIVPWNYPVMLSVGPLISVLAAGNRAMLKLSEFTPATNKAIINMLNSAFEDDLVCAVEGEVEVAQAFSELPFDHLLFTGSTAVGKHVMAAASKNLTPVTLELGGKSPAIITSDMSIDTAVERLIFGKCLNAGQTCIAPDYILVPEEKVEALINAFTSAFNRLYPDALANPDFTSVINPSQYNRLQSWLEDAKQKGASIHPLQQPATDDAKQRMVLHLLTGGTDEMTMMQEEIFGPAMPIVTYKTLTDAIEYVNDRPRPLALYILSHDTSAQKQILQQTHAGGVCINESTLHVAQDDLPFGGVGPSGMGHYHGPEGFKTFSKYKPVLKYGKLAMTKLIHPPYGNTIQRILLKLLTR